MSCESNYFFKKGQIVPIFLGNQGRWTEIDWTVEVGILQTRGIIRYLTDACDYVCIEEEEEDEEEQEDLFGEDA